MPGIVAPSLSLVTGHLANGKPGLVAYSPDGTAKYIGIAVIGAPGPADIKGVEGDWVLMAQGRGYQVYNYKTGELSRSDETATPQDQR